MNKIFFWKHFLTKPASTASLGKILEERRCQQGLSISQMAAKAHLKETIIETLEKNDFSQQQGNEVKPYMLSHRLDAIRYARALGLEGAKIQEILPPLPSLNPPGRTLLSNLSSVENKTPKKASFWKRQLKLIPVRSVPLQAKSISGRRVLKIFKIIVLIIILLFVWKEVRHLKRVLWNVPSNTTSEVSQQTEEESDVLDDDSRSDMYEYK